MKRQELICRCCRYVHGILSEFYLNGISGKVVVVEGKVTFSKELDSE